MIRFEKVSKSYKENQILRGVSFSVKKGDFVVFIGPSGCGKTTMLKMINKLINPTSGKIYINGEDVEKKNEIELRRRMGYVIQSIGLFPHMTIRDNIELIPKLTGMSLKAITHKSAELMEMVGLEPGRYLDRYPTQLSGGQQQRIGVVRALAADPDIVLMDEPFSALDPITRSQLQDELALLQVKLKKTFVFVTHDMGEAIKLADKICIMNQGEVVQYDTPEQILKNPANEFVQNFVGKKRIWSVPELIRAKDIMIKSVTGSRVFSLLKSLELMRNANVDSLMVVDEKGQLEGVVYAGDILDRLEPDGSAADVLNEVPCVVAPRDNIINVLEAMQVSSVSSAPVVDEEGMLLGMITRSSLVTTLSRQYLEKEERAK